MRVPEDSDAESLVPLPDGKFRMVQSDETGHSSDHFPCLVRTYREYAYFSKGHPLRHKSDPLLPRASRKVRRQREAVALERALESMEHEWPNSEPAPAMEPGPSNARSDAWCTAAARPTRKSAIAAVVAGAPNRFAALEKAPEDK